MGKGSSEKHTAMHRHYYTYHNLTKPLKSSLKYSGLRVGGSCNDKNRESYNIIYNRVYSILKNVSLLLTGKENKLG